MVSSKVTAISHLCISKVSHFVYVSEHVQRATCILCLRSIAGYIVLKMWANAHASQASWSVAGPVFRFHVTSVSMRKRATYAFEKGDCCSKA